MLQVSKYECEVCGRQKGSGTWWLAIATGAALTVRLWDDDLARHTDMKHLCSPLCRSKYVDKWAAGQRLAAERQLGEVSAQ